MKSKTKVVVVGGGVVGVVLFTIQQKKAGLMLFQLREKNLHLDQLGMQQDYFRCLI